MARSAAPLATDWRKPFLTIAPYLIVVFRLDYEPVRLVDGTERRRKNQYVQESVGISVGILLSALHLAGLATLTHTPSPVGFLAEVLGRPTQERPFLLIPVGYPAPDARVPDLKEEKPRRGSRAPLAAIDRQGLTSRPRSLRAPRGAASP